MMLCHSLSQNRYLLANSKRALICRSRSFGLGTIEIQLSPYLTAAHRILDCKTSNLPFTSFVNVGLASATSSSTIFRWVFQEPTYAVSMPVKSGCYLRDLGAAFMHAEDNSLLVIGQTCTTRHFSLTTIYIMY
ncbi:uncharacterized protein LOC124461188 [Drosophila willistoni]|uniref:uncharacterized protein LOC124461188 n=1 Tax=Drosophila willistoni TaxID=7260 RepID=UPI001F075282|nr:uncharacterized protein LOC124461188 [Drosophila willistoni]